jgi:phage terminase large subunit-like protein
VDGRKTRYSLKLKMLTPEQIKFGNATAIAVEVEMLHGYKPPRSYKNRPIEYIDPSPKPFITQIPLVEYWERQTRWKADPWQVDLGNRLQEAAENRHIRGVREIYHAEPQIGKTVWISQHLPAWLLGHDPLFRFALAMYNMAQSEKHSKQVIRILSSQLHKDIFPNKDGWLYQDKAAQSGWYTNAGREANAGQFSFNPVGLISGLTGSGFDWLVGDDPYRSEKDAFSVMVNEAIRNFLDFLESRIGLHSNLSLMFHRYAYDDAAAYSLDKGDFNYIRYATQCDGDYVHPNTGQKFTDPLNREIGEYLSPRRGPEFYAKVKKNPRVWTSMNQGRPQAAGSEFFMVDRIQIQPASIAAQRKAECDVLVRAWDLAATEQAGDWSVAPLVGMNHSGRVTFFETVRKQVESAGRDKLMLETAQRDGFGVVISVPQDPGAAGLTALYHIQQLLKGYEVVPRSTSGSKEDRARPLSSVVNSGDVEFIDDAELAEDAKWIEATKKEMREFLMSALAHDDCIDSGADGYNECFERISKGLVIKDFKPQRNLITYDQFKALFPHSNGTPNAFKIPAAWMIYVGVKITPDASMANSGIIVVRASEGARLGETLFIVAEYKEYTADYADLFTWIDRALKEYCANPKAALIWLHKDSEAHLPTIKQKLKYNVRVFKGDDTEGLTETNWYLKPLETDSPFTSTEKASRLYGLIADPSQISVATNADGLYAVRQEAATWGFNAKGEPSAVGGVLDCLRMVTQKFRTKSTPLTLEQKVDLLIPAEVKQELKNPERKLEAQLEYEFHKSIAINKLIPVEQRMEEWE